MRPTPSAAQPIPGIASSHDGDAGLLMLLDAFIEASREHRPAEVSVIPLNRLVGVGLPREELDRLVCEGLVERCDVEGSENGRLRTGQKRRIGEQQPRCGYVLTPCGATAAFWFLYASETDAATAVTGSVDRQVLLESGERPVWDDTARELWWRSRLVKRFRYDAANQRLVLTALAEQAWVSRIDDPLRREAGVDPKVRRRETVKRLHRGQLPVVLRFHADGTASGLRWEAVV